MTKRLLLIFCLFSSLISCTDNREKRTDIVKDKIEIINHGLFEWNKLSQEILNNAYVNSKLGKYIKAEELNEELKGKLLDKGIVRFSLQKFDRCTTVDYLTNWTEYPIGSLYLTWTTCDTTQTRKGYYLDNFIHTLLKFEV